MKNLKGKRVLITGVGIKPLDFVFKDVTTGESSHTPIISEAGKEFKANIGAATALECVKAGAIVHLVARTKDNLKIVKDWIEIETGSKNVEYLAVDLNNTDSLKQLVDTIPSDLPLYWVQSVGLGAGTVELKDNNPYLTIDELSQELIEAELSVLTTTTTLLKLLLPRFRDQEETRVCIISSMSAVRSFTSGSIHNAAKGAISRFTNAATIELNQDNIFVTDIRPGIVDTGLYDSKLIQDIAQKVGKSFGRDYSKSNIFCMPPSSIGEIIVNALTSRGHITSVNIVARGQWPHEGS